MNGIQVKALKARDFILARHATVLVLTPKASTFTVKRRLGIYHFCYDIAACPTYPNGKTVYTIKDLRDLLAQE